MGEGDFWCSLNLSAKVLADSPMYFCCFQDRLLLCLLHDHCSAFSPGLSENSGLKWDQFNNGIGAAPRIASSTGGMTGYTGDTTGCTGGTTGCTGWTMGCASSTTDHGWDCKGCVSGPLSAIWLNQDNLLSFGLEWLMKILK